MYTLRVAVKPLLMLDSSNHSMSKESWALNNYDVGPTGYDDSPLYTWDAGFDFKAFEEALEDYNAKDGVAFFDNLDELAAQRGEDALYTRA